MKHVLRVLKTVLRNKKKKILKNRFKHLKRKCFSVFRQKQSLSHGVKDRCKNLQRFSFKLLKPFCPSSEQVLKRPQVCNFIEKEPLAQVFSCEFCEISKNTFSTEPIQTTASGVWENADGNYKKELHCTKNEFFLQFPADLVTFTEEILNGKLHFL